MKPIVRKPHIEDGFHRDDFCIDTKARTVTCPAGHTARIRPGGTAPFAKRCRGCPLRARCTTSKKGRTIKVDQHHDRRAANKARWAKEETKQTYRNLRPSVERTIAWLTHGKARRVPYRGITRNQQWLTTRTAAINLRRLINLGLAHTTTGWATNPAQNPQNPDTAPNPTQHSNLHKPQPAPPHQHSQPDNQQAPRRRVFSMIRLTASVGPLVAPVR